MILADASSNGLGAVLRHQEENGEWRLVAYVSKTLSSTECRYAQIKKRWLLRGLANASEISFLAKPYISKQITNHWCQYLQRKACMR